MEDTTAQELIARVERLLDRAISRLRLDLADLAREFGGVSPVDDEAETYLRRRDAVDLDEVDEDDVLNEPDDD